MRRDPALDGIRAVAVVAVLAYHGGLPWSQGGFLGVDVFFVVSGYLITTGLLGGVRLRAFWMRRARRLLPALVAVVLATAVYAAVAAPADTIVGLRGDALAALAYVANWRFVAAGRSYFAQAAPPSLLQHTWSLAIEEQFYVVWPLVVLACRRRPRSLLPVTALLTLGSAALMATLYHAGHDPSRVYFGTDTHAQSVLVGCLLASLLADRPAPSRRLGGLAWLGGAGVLACVVRFGASSALLYRGGFLLVSVSTAAVVAGLVTGSAPGLAALLGRRAPARIGLISYGIYLWHWPVFLVVDGARTGMTGWALFAVRAAITYALAEVSFRVVESPFLEGRAGVPRAVAVPALAAASIGVLFITSGAIVTAGAAPAVAAGASPARTRVVLVEGDSVALTLGVGLSVAAAGHGARVVDRGTLGCGVLQGGPIFDEGARVQPPAACATSDRRWTADIRAAHPDLVVLLVGRWEVMDRRVDGMRSRLGAPVFDAAVVAGLTDAVRVLGAGGTRVGLVTAPYYRGREQPDGARWPQDDPRRVDRFNAIVRQVAATTGAVIVDLNRVIDPAGSFESRVAREQVRWSDGIHITIAGGVLAAPAVFGALP